MGDRLFGDDGEAIELEAVLGEGGEGVVRRVRGPRPRAAKIYARAMTAEQHDKLRAMRDRPPASDARAKVSGLAWPEALVYRDEARTIPAGFVMTAYPAARELHMLFNPAERMIFAGGTTWRDLHEIAAKVAEIVAAVHREGHCVGDVNARNVLVCVAERQVVWIDTDSFQIREAGGRIFPCRVGCSEYAPPDLPVCAAPRTTASDAYSLAVLVHQVLASGSHPFDAIVRGADVSLEERMRRGATPIAGDPGVAFPPDTLPFTALRPALRRLFRRAFAEGTRDPRARPSAAEWASALRVAAGDLVRCRAVATHVLSKGAWNRLSRACPWCAAAARTGLDVFPPAGDWQRAIARYARPSAAPRPLREEWFDRHLADRLCGGRLTYEAASWLRHVASALDLGEAYAARRLDGIVDAKAPPAAPSAAPKEDPPARVGPASIPPLVAPARPFGWLEPPPSPSWRYLVAGLAPIALAAQLVGPPAADAPAPPRAGDASAAAPPPPAATKASRGDAWIRASGASRVNLREAPSIASPGAPLRAGTRVAILSDPVVVGGRSWTPVRAPSGRPGWIADAYLARAKPSPARP